LKNIYEFVIVVTTVILVAAIISTTVSDVFAAKPTSGFKGSGDCSWSSDSSKTCCWRESNGVSLGESYCQTCTIKDGQPTTCTEKELQFRSNQQGGLGTISPDDGGVLAESEESNQGTGAQIPLEGGVFSKQP